MKRWLASCLVLFALFGCNKLLPRAAGPQPIVDADYQFRLSAPGSGWKLLAEKEIRRLVPDAVAGAAEFGHGVADRNGAVIVEAYTGDKPRLLADALIGHMPLEDKQVVSMTDLQFEKQPAVRYEVTGKISGLEVRYLNVVFLHQSHAYQVLAWGLAGHVSAKSLQDFAGAFRLTEGPIHDRSRLRKVEDTRGVGWRVKGGVFESATDGLILRPRPGWQLSIGDDLARMNDNAEVGLLHDGPEAYLMVIPEALNGTSREAYVKICLDHNAKALGVMPAAGPPLQAEIDGQAFEVARFRHAQRPFEYLLGVSFHGDMGYLIMIWYEVTFTDQGQSLLQTAVAGLSFLPEPARQALGRELLALPDVQVAIGPSHALRRGVYRDFARQLTWRKPAAAMRIFVGQEARKHNQDATFYFEEPESGRYGLLIVETADVDGGAYHDAAARGVVAGGNGGSRVGPTPMLMGERPALSTVVKHHVNGVLLTQQLVTTTGDGRAYQVLLWGRPAAMADSSAWVKTVLGSFRFGALSPLQWEGEALTEQRMGFVFRPPAQLGADWQHRDVTPKEMRPLGTIMEWKNGRYNLALIAIHALESGQDEDWFMEQLRQNLKDRFAVLSSEEITPDRLGEEPARRISIKQLGQLHGEVLVLCRDRTFYALAVDRLSGTLEPAVTDAIKAGFRFLD